MEILGIEEERMDVRLEQAGIKLSVLRAGCREKLTDINNFGYEEGWENNCKSIASTMRWLSEDEPEILRVLASVVGIVTDTRLFLLKTRFEEAVPLSLGRRGR